MTSKKRKRPSALQQRHAANLDKRKRSAGRSSVSSKQSGPRRSPETVESHPGTDGALDQTAESMEPRTRLAFLTILTLAGAISYAPSIYQLSIEWDRLPDYSHGYLVIPFALVLAWLRRDSLPQLRPNLQAMGLSLIAASFVVRWAGAAYFIQFVDGISITLWVAGSLWIVGGWRLLLWSLPSTSFLVFMVPIPYTINLMVSGPLQRVATIISTWTLQLLGQPALSEGNIILLNDHTLEVAQACSGLRIFVGILALAHFIIFMSRRPWIENAIILLSVLPIALTANAIRIIATGMLMQYASTKAAKTFTHDIAGWLMIPLACLLFWMFIWYLTHLFPRVKQLGLEAAAGKGANLDNQEQISPAT